LALKKLNMEFTVVDAHGLPSKPVLAIRLGVDGRPARVLRRLEVGKPFTVPHPGQSPVPVELTLFQELVSQDLPEFNEKESFFSMPLRQLDRSCTQVNLCMRKKAAVPKVDDERQARQARVKEYLERHQVTQHIQDLLREVLTKEPSNPYQFMLQQLQQKKLESSSAHEADRTSDGSDGGGPRSPSQTYPGRTGRSSQAAKHNISRREISDPAVAKAVSGDMAPNVVSRVVRNMVREATDVAMIAEVSKVTVHMAMQRCLPLLFKAEHRTVTRFAVDFALRGAWSLVLIEEGLIDAERRASMPRPVVCLDGGKNWGRWLAPGNES